MNSYLAQLMQTLWGECAGYGAESSLPSDTPVGEMRYPGTISLLYRLLIIVPDVHLAHVQMSLCIQGYAQDWTMWSAI